MTGGEQEDRRAIRVTLHGGTASDVDVDALKKWLERERSLEAWVRDDTLRIHERARTDDSASGRPEYASGTLLTAIIHAVQRPRTPYYGAFTQALTSALAPLFGGAPPKDEQVADDLDKALREALPTHD
jgi:hypothetical protein